MPSFISGERKSGKRDRHQTDFRYNKIVDTFPYFIDPSSAPILWFLHLSNRPHKVRHLIFSPFIAGDHWQRRQMRHKNGMHPDANILELLHHLIVRFSFWRDLGLANIHHDCHTGFGWVGMWYVIVVTGPGVGITILNGRSAVIFPSLPVAFFFQ